MLGKLDLSGNRINDIRELSQLHNLEELDVSQNKITNFTSLYYAVYKSHISKLRFHSNPFNSVSKELLNGALCYLFECNTIHIEFRGKYHYPQHIEYIDCNENICYNEPECTTDEPKNYMCDSALWKAYVDGCFRESVP